MKNRLLAESMGSAALLAIVVGSGIMGERLGQGNAAIALLANSFATGAGLYVLITLLAPISGAHLNPLVTVVLWRRGQLAGARVPGYIIAQVAGAIAGVWLTHAMFDLPVLQFATKLRVGPGQWLSEVVATFGLLVTIVLGAQSKPAAVPALVACYIGAAYWFTASTAFANPAVTIARGLTDSFAGIRPADVAAFVLAQVAATGLFLIATRLLPEIARLHPFSSHSLRSKRPMTDSVFNVLFLCTGNSARSILAESLLAKDGAGRFRAFSAGSQPKGEVNPLAIRTLASFGYPVEGLRSKSWDEFEQPGAPAMDFVFTVCDNAAGETCPIWPGHSIKAHWGIEDPAAAEGTTIEQLKAFAVAFKYLKNRIDAFIALPTSALQSTSVRKHLDEIGRGAGASDGVGAGA